MVWFLRLMQDRPRRPRKYREAAALDPGRPNGHHNFINVCCIFLEM